MKLSMQNGLSKYSCASDAFAVQVPHKARRVKANEWLVYLRIEFGEMLFQSGICKMIFFIGDEGY